MAPLKILITGAGIAGTALAFWLAKLGHDVTVIERAVELRTSGLQLDLRGPGIQVLRRMGLEGAFRRHAVAEEGLRLVDGKGKSWGYFGANRSGKGVQSLTTDWEIMRGDLCKMFVDACGDRVKFGFGVHVVGVREVDGGVEVEFSNGKTDRFDLVVGADGLWSKTRRMMLAADGDENPGYHSIGVFAGYCTISSEIEDGEQYDATGFITTGNRGIMIRRHDPHKIQAYVMCDSRASERLIKSKRGDIEEEKRALADVFLGAGWKSEQILHGLVGSDDFYCERMGVIKLNEWSRGRIALVGDAAYCPSAMTGMGTTCGIVGAYILAGEIDKHCRTSAGKETIKDALAAYEQRFRPYMDQVQKGLTDTDHYMDKLPSSPFGIGVLYFVFWIASVLRLDIIAQWMLREKADGWELPEYPDMHA
ncbi:putative FAD-binding monooxygenase [Aspergillus mulundensis]|uniref:FAD-binding domain-containing protein n=1 Tax=Aspergillus mulundensis TaxID=1810919 RepID=A0A3D8S4Y3_9EURO|nr:hypothetical protein DSM5745_04817 [Aspergillus mulundensis]RDW81260.1 hypothetical protein DSM5745_04817 [Aspergillus mulundensis]